MYLSKVSSSSSNTIPTKMKSVGKAKGSPRPYTTYNIFFQLERAYILQHDLGVLPNLSPEEVFTHSDPNYQGPTLPPKYQNLLLQSDWYRPGKALRKKRQHRATHGKIGFTDLSKRIAAGWHNCDGPVKIFCAHLSDIGMMKYKREAHEQSKKRKMQASSSTGTVMTPNDCQSSSLLAITNDDKFQSQTTLSNTVRSSVAASASSSPYHILPPQRQSVSPVNTSSEQPITVTDLPPLPDEVISFIRSVFAEPHPALPVALALPSRPLAALPPRTISNGSVSSSSAGGVVDMGDNEIFNIWTGLG